MDKDPTEVVRGDGNLRLPSKVHFKDVWKVLEKKGFVPVNRKGSHILFFRPRLNVGDEDRYVILVCHKQVKKGTLLNIIRRAGMTKEEFLDLF